ncbi:MAG: 2-oxoglutarate oxidoreductase [Synergistaceae bacterium]|nr:thiamine pyrophosphate-dependent enzyme [Synergistota bacterium]NLM71186.1 2-oxoglutarate oxidoreductase [Synergistaceae bacterium]
MSEVKVYSRPKSWMPDVSSHYCPGCGHGIAHRLVCETLDELSIQDDAIGLAPVGCAAMIYDYIDTDFLEAPHGRAPAVATGIKTVRPDKVVYTYQGDGDLASIGMGEIVHAANRGQNLTVIFINNAIYGMTGGQMAPTTLVGQRASTCPLGRDVKVNGYPIRISEMLAALPAPGYIERVTVAQPKYIIKAKKAVKKAFQNQIDGKGFSLVEILSSCPTNWGMRPVEAFDWVVNTMMPYYPLGVFKDFD